MKRILFFIMVMFFINTYLHGYTKIKDRQGTIHYNTGNKYVGTYLLDTKTKELYPNGKGTMYYADGGTLEGIWLRGKITQGTYKKDHVVFKGKIQNSFWNGLISFSNDNLIQQFSGEVVPYLLTFKNGQIAYKNGDSFEGEFSNNKPLKGKYHYANETNIHVNGEQWQIPAGCIFNGIVPDFTGTVDQPITNKTGDKYIGSLKNGKPNGQGKMTFANGKIEEGIWHDGLNDTEYIAQQKAQQKALQEAHEEAERKKKEEEQNKKEEERLMAVKYDQECLKKFKNTEIPDGNLRNIKDRDIFHGAAIMLSQLFVGQKIIYQGYSEPVIYTCLKFEDTIEIEDTRRTRIVVLEVELETTDNKKIKRYVYGIHNSSGSSLIKNIPYPDELNYQYTTIKISDTYNWRDPWWDSSSTYSLLKDRELAINRAKNYWIKKYGERYGRAIINKEILLGMSVDMVQAIHGRGSISRNRSSLGEVVVLSYNWSHSYTFVNGRLTEYNQPY